MKELTNKLQIIQYLIDNWNHGSEEMLPVLFHGTDMSTISLSESQLTEIYEACSIISNQLYAHFEELGLVCGNYVDKRFYDFIDDYGNTGSAIRFLTMNKNGSKLYQHGDFYVANTPDKALLYTEEANILGEIGWIANRMYDGALQLGIKLPSNVDFIEALKILEERRRIEKNPIVVLVSNEKLKNLKTETGYSAEFDSLNPRFEDSFRVKVESNVDSDKNAYVTKAHFDELQTAWYVFINNHFYDKDYLYAIPVTVTVSFRSDTEVVDYKKYFAFANELKALIVNKFNAEVKLVVKSKRVSLSYTYEDNRERIFMLLSRVCKTVDKALGGDFYFVSGSVFMEHNKLGEVKKIDDLNIEFTNFYGLA